MREKGRRKVSPASPQSEAINRLPLNILVAGERVLEQQSTQVDGLANAISVCLLRGDSGGE